MVKVPRQKSVINYVHQYCFNHFRVIDPTLGIELFDKNFTIIQGLLHSELLKQQTITIGFDQSLSKSDMYENKYM